MTTYETRRILISGGTGFIGQAITKVLLVRGQSPSKGTVPIRILSRDQTKARMIFPNQPIEIVEADITRTETLSRVCENVDWVIQCAQFPGHPVENKRKHHTYFEVDALGTENLAKAAKRAGVKHFIYISGAGTDGKKSEPWFKAKWYAEQAIHSTGIPATILRPSWVYGPGDKSLNRILRMAKIFPIVPLIDGGKNHVQPIYIDDLAKIVLACVETAGDTDRIFDVGGPEEMTMKEMLSRVFHAMGRRPFFLPVPKWPLKLVGFKAVDFITMDVKINIEPLKKVFPNIQFQTLLGSGYLSKYMK